ncbi:sulfotransferase [Thiohalobacter sp. IOR34]|uniref:sulfotransferase family protein n=1 Tax=Thiohalobacter sp. IOR34 TaxID=3057176 RepID=UPI0025B2676B|nr:sulfotransferase [Thiohalobacter sp. IOR34]WJW75200.1 sulfotransferase [Thiohalobacter sp. IOR34]
MSCFFVGGVNRAGTTLLQNILCSDETTNPLVHEASYLRSIVEAYVFGLQKFDEHGKYYFDSRQDLRDFTAAWLKGFLDKIRARYPETRHLVLKHPPLTPRLPALHDLLAAAGEDARFFIIVRDPRDVAASLVRVGERLRAKGDSEGATLPRDMEQLGSYYMKCYMPALAHQDKDYQARITLIRYEDLVRDPEPVIAKLRQASGLALNLFDPGSDWRKTAIDFKSLEKEKNAWLSPLWGKGLSNRRVGAYRNILNEQEIRALEKICAGPLKTFGYL